MVYKSEQIFLPFFSQFTRVTDGRTDGQTDRILITIPRLHYMQCGKKEKER